MEDKVSISAELAAKETVSGYRKVSDYSGSAKILRIVNLVLSFALFVAAISWSIYRVAAFGFNDPELRYLASFAIGIFGLVPFVLEKILKTNFSNFILLLFLIFLIFAGFIGSGIGMYRKWDVFYYDKITHGIFGYIACIAALYIYTKLNDYSVARASMVVIFCFAISMACGAMWEIFEFASDRLLGATAQGEKLLEGYAIVKDTMQDILANFLGAVLFVVQYIFHRATKRNLLLGSMLKDFMQ